MVWLQRGQPKDVYIMQAREALTIRFPIELLSTARQVKAEQESLNDLVVGAVEREVRRRQGLQAYDQILRVRETAKARTGLQADSTHLIRALREGTDFEPPTGG